MDQQAVQRFQRIRSVQAQLSFRVARQVQSGRLVQRSAAANRDAPAARTAAPARRAAAPAPQAILVRHTAT